MELDLLFREAEVQALRQEVTRLSRQLEESRAAVVQLSRRLKLVMEEKVALQEQMLLRWGPGPLLKSAPLRQMEGQQEKVQGEAA